MTATTDQRRRERAPAPQTVNQADWPYRAHLATLVRVASELVPLTLHVGHYPRREANWEWAPAGHLPVLLDNDASRWALHHLFTLAEDCRKLLAQGNPRPHIVAKRQGPGDGADAVQLLAWVQDVIGANFMYPDQSLVYVDLGTVRSLEPVLALPKPRAPTPST